MSSKMHLPCDVAILQKKIGYELPRSFLFSPLFALLFLLGSICGGFTILGVFLGRTLDIKITGEYTGRVCRLINTASR